MKSRTSSPPRPFRRELVRCLSEYVISVAVSTLIASGHALAAQTPALLPDADVVTVAAAVQQQTSERSAPSNDADQDKKRDAENKRGFRWTDHPSLLLGHDTNIDFRVRVVGHVLDSEAEIGNPDTFDIARRRIGVEGQLIGTFDFQIEREFAAGGWRDVYVDYRQFAWARVQAGHFKLPFSLDENTSATNQDFAYRSRAATELAPGRDSGVMLHGRVRNSILRYEIGWFAHDGRNARSRTNPDRVYGQGTLAGRFSVQPFRKAKSLLSDLQVAVAFTESDVPEGIAAVQGRTTLDASFFPASYWVEGQRYRTGVEARWRPGPFSVKAEYMRMSTQRLAQGVDDADLPPLVASGWYVSGTWLPTGEAKAAGVERPRRSLLRGGFGAIELAGRVEGLTFGSAGPTTDMPSTSPRASTLLRNSDRAATMGVNWYPIRGVKIQANLIRESIADPSRGPLPAQHSFWSRVLRIQFTM